MRMRSSLLALSAVLALSFAADASAMQATRTIKVISSEGARAMVDACTEWATQRKVTIAMAVLDWGGNLIESHAMEGAAGNAGFRADQGQAGCSGSPADGGAPPVASRGACPDRSDSGSCISVPRISWSVWISSSRSTCDFANVRLNW